jgi:hypothetical protein
LIQMRELYRLQEKSPIRISTRGIPKYFAGFLLLSREDW